MEAFQAFATAFLNDTAGYINERKNKAEDYEQRMRDLAERNKGVHKQLMQAGKGMSSQVSQAKGLHASDAQIEAALDAGPSGLSDLVSKLTSYQAEIGASNFTPQAVAEFAKLPAAYQPTGNIDPMARLGLSNYKVGDVEAPEYSFWDKALGRSAQDAARARLDAEVTAEGMSIYDMAEIGNAAGYESLNTGSYLSYVAPKRITPEMLGSVQEDFDKTYTDAREAATAEFKTERDSVTAYDTTKKQEIYDEISQKEDEYVRAYMSRHVLSGIANYDNYTDVMGSMLMSEQYSKYIPEDILKGIQELDEETSEGLPEDTTSDVITTTDLDPPKEVIETFDRYSLAEDSSGVRRLYDNEEKMWIPLEQSDDILAVLEASRPETPEVPPAVVGDNVEPRPTGRTVAFRNAKQDWDRKYAATHNIDGTPRKVEPQEVAEVNYGGTASQWDAAVERYNTGGSN